MTESNWNLDPPPGFQGLHPDIPVHFYFRHLPHWRQDGATYFVTFRLADSLPQSKLRELESIKQEWLTKQGLNRTDWQSVLRDSTTDQQRQALARELMENVEKWLDQGMGSCWMNRPDAAKTVSDALRHFDGERYELGCYVVMPNHVHAVIRPLAPRDDPLEKILQSRKMRAAQAINALVGRSGTLWQEESFDRIIRDAEHLYRCIQYIGRNPRLAGLLLENWRRWIRPSWEEIGWRFNE